MFSFPIRFAKCVTGRWDLNLVFPSSILFYFSSFLWVYLPQSMYVYIVYVCYIHEEASRRQKRILDPLEMEL